MQQVFVSPAPRQKCTACYTYNTRTKSYTSTPLTPLLPSSDPLQTIVQKHVCPPRSRGFCWNSSQYLCISSSSLDNFCNQISSSNRIMIDFIFFGCNLHHRSSWCTCCPFHCRPNSVSNPWCVQTDSEPHQCHQLAITSSRWVVVAAVIVHLCRLGGNRWR